MIPLCVVSVSLCDVVSPAHVCTRLHMYCVCVVRPGWSPAGGMIPACISPLWGSMWCVPPSVTLCSLLGGRPGLELQAEKNRSQH